MGFYYLQDSHIRLQKSHTIIMRLYWPMYLDMIYMRHCEIDMRTHVVHIKSHQVILAHDASGDLPQIGDV